jgi:hypothetical protein
MNNEIKESDGKCGTCLWFVGYRHLNGQCRRRSPIAIVEDTIYDTRAGWPRVDSDHFCGEYEWYGSKYA